MARTVQLAPALAWDLSFLLEAHLPSGPFAEKVPVEIRSRRPESYSKLAVSLQTVTNVEELYGTSIVWTVAEGPGLLVGVLRRQLHTVCGAN